jgi:hypothetical protein
MIQRLLTHSVAVLIATLCALAQNIDVTPGYETNRFVFRQKETSPMEVDMYCW